MEYPTRIPKCPQVADTDTVSDTDTSPILKYPCFIGFRIEDDAASGGAISIYGGGSVGNSGCAVRFVGGGGCDGGGSGGGGVVVKGGSGAAGDCGGVVVVRGGGGAAGGCRRGGGGGGCGGAGNGGGGGGR
ncbi:loricrin-like [Papaver somniferum]|uniref:loricrin-like n=1 Tax=Papaver somniferum TaxID=3469 RepID=UPI000E6F6EA6|nr:loricrin-like [Papaver somniferum]